MSLPTEVTNLCTSHVFSVPFVNRYSLVYTHMIRAIVVVFVMLSLNACMLFPKKLDEQALTRHLENRTFTVILNNSGKYMSPFTSDGVAAAWVEKSLQAKLGAAVGSFTGIAAAQSASESVPTGPFGHIIGAEIGRRVALSVVGGKEYLKSTSDISFNSLDHMALWLVANHRNHPQFKEIMNATFEIYPYLRPRYDKVIRGQL